MKKLNRCSHLRGGGWGTGADPMQVGGLVLAPWLSVLRVCGLVSASPRMLSIATGNMKVVEDSYVYTL